MIRVFEYKVYPKNIGVSAAYFKRIFLITKWLNKRYNLNSENVEYEHLFLKGDKEINKITIRLTFHE